jgi:hypothetical protein
MKFLVGCTLVLVSGWVGIVALLAVVTEHQDCSGRLERPRVRQK